MTHPMRKRAVIVLVAVFLLGCSGSTGSAEGDVPSRAELWMTDYAKALETAKSQNKRTMLYFTGSDWCGWCKKLKAEILYTPEFEEYARKNLVLVSLDFPRRTKLPATLQEQNQKLAKQHGIRGFPTLIVLDAEGKKIGKLGYMRGGPKPFLEALEKLR